MLKGDLIRSLRESKGMTQSDLARAIGTTKQTIYKYETSVVVNPPLEVIEKIANALGTTPQNLVGWEVRPAPTDDEIKFALFGDTETSDDVFDEVKRFAEFAKNKYLEGDK